MSQEVPGLESQKELDLAPPTDDRVARQPPNSTLYKPVEDHLRNRLQQLFPGDDEAVLSWTLRNYAAAEVDKFHESTFRSMYGSQLSALNYVNQVSPADPANLNPFYQSFRDSDVHKDFGIEISFEQWLSYLTNSTYLAYNDDGSIYVTELGRNFMQWLISNGVNQWRPG